MDKNSFVKTPPMGWNSYDYYDTTVNEQQIKANADFMAEKMAYCGWKYIVVDIEWYSYGAGSMREKYQYIPFGKVEMDEYGRLLPCPERFPSSVNGAGFKPLADYIHTKGLKFGIHIMRGIPRMAAHMHCKIKGCDVTANEVADPSSICAWNPDMYGVRHDVTGAQEYYDSLLELYAQWGVDFIKCDDICRDDIDRSIPFSTAKEVEMLHHAIAKCGREIVLSLSPGPAVIESAWHYEKYANMWRITDDFWDNWDLLLNMFKRCELWQNHVSEGCYPDCDMLPLGYVGKGFGAERQTQFTKEEQVTMMTLWCLFGSPLMLGAEMTKLDDWTLSLLTNWEVLSLSSPAFRRRQLERDDKGAVWHSHHPDKAEHYIALFNFEEEKEMSFDLKQAKKDGILTSYGKVREVWTGREIAVKDGILTDVIPRHGAGLYCVEEDKSVVKVVCLGDSITEGFGVELKEAYPCRLQEYLGDGWQVYNKGLCCCTVIDKMLGERPMGLPYLRQKQYLDGLAVRGDIYVILLGTNDAQDGIGDVEDVTDPYLNMISVKEEFVSCYQRIIDGIRAVVPEAKIYMGVPAPVMQCIWRKHQEKYLQQLFPFYQEIAERNPDIAIIDVHRAFMDLPEKERAALYSKDNLHPNADGLDFIARTVEAAIREK